MPIYRYRCAQCGAQEEHLQKISDPPVETCASCGGALGKLMTSAAFHLKGGGWYKDLYASSKPGSSDGASSNAGDSSKSASADTSSSNKSSGDSNSSSSSSSSASAPSSSKSASVE